MWCQRCRSFVCKCSSKPFDSFVNPKPINTFVAPRPLPLPQPMYKPPQMPTTVYQLMPTPPGFMKF